VSRTVRPASEDALVGSETRSERTASLLIARLDALARVAGRLPNVEAERLIELATVATMRAVALQLLEAEQADAIWQEAHARHPQLRRVEIDLPARLAA
jgi:hypothetical protein